jgi:protoporphyrinogen oxidase
MAVRDSKTGAAARNPKPQRWCIVGGGMLGLAMAHKLAAPGREITVLEASDRLGGLADAWTVGPVTWDRHYHVTLMSDLHMRGLLDDIGLGDEMNWRTTRTDFYENGRFHPLNNAIDFLRFPPLNIIDKARLAFTILYASRLKNGVRLESVPVKDWLVKLSGKRTYERIWQPLLRAKLGDNHKIVSASFIWSVINRFYSARRAGLEKEMFGYVTGGYASIIEKLTASLDARGVTCRAGQPVIDIDRSQRGGVTVSTPSGRQTFDHVVVTAPGDHAARMCSGLTEAERERLAALRYQGVVCASVVLKKPLRGRYLTYVADDTIPLTGVIEMTAVVDRDTFAGRTLVYLPHYLPADHPLFNEDEETIRASCIANLRKMYRHIEEDDIIAFKVSRARNVMAVQALNYSKAVPPMETTVPGLHIVNSAQIINGNLNVDETIGLADRAVKTLVAATVQAAPEDGRNPANENRIDAIPA